MSGHFYYQAFLRVLDELISSRGSQQHKSRDAFVRNSAREVLKAFRVGFWKSSDSFRDGSFSPKDTMLQ